MADLKSVPLRWVIGTCAVLVTSIALFRWEYPAKPPFKSPDILVIGDSQISYGAGKIHLEFFENLKSKCNPTSEQKRLLARMDFQSVGAIGVRSSSLHTWTLADNNAKAMVCEVDKKFGVNAGVYGISGVRQRQYVQIGQGDAYQFCKQRMSPFQAMFAAGYYDPKLLVVAFLGNSTERWSTSKNEALQDARLMMEQIPKKTPCIFMTTAPSYEVELNDQRQIAQENIKSAFEEIGSRCSLVEGVNRETRKANGGNSDHFRTNKEGVVIDPHHPKVVAARAFFKIITPNLCHAIFEQLPTRN